VRRLRLVRELPPKKLFRVVESEIIDDLEPVGEAQEAAVGLQRELLAAFKRAMPRVPNAHEQLDQLLGSQITLGMLADIVSYTIDLPLDVKLRLLEETDVLRRTRLLLDAIASRPQPGPARTFPPDFSVN
jgi:hypothetical protein